MVTFCTFYRSCWRYNVLYSKYINFWRVRKSRGIFLTRPPPTPAPVFFPPMWEALVFHIYHIANTISQLYRTCTFQGVRNVRFSQNLACFIFFKHSFWDSHFCLITEDLMNFDDNSQRKYLDLCTRRYRTKHFRKTASGNYTGNPSW